MKGFLYKTFMQSRTNLITYTIISAVMVTASVLFAVFGDKNGVDVNLFRSIFLICAFFVISNANSDIVKVDEGAKKASFIASAPRGVIYNPLSKYIVFLTEIIIVFALCELGEVVYGLVTGDFSFPMLKVTFIIASVDLLFCAIEFPFMLRFGAQKGRTIKSTVVLVIIVAAGIYFLFGDISFLLGEDPIGDLIRFLSEDLETVINILPIIFTGLYIVSCAVSPMLYKKGLLVTEE